MFSDFFKNSFFQNYHFLYFAFLLSFIFLITLTLFSFRISFRFCFSFICFVLVCIFVNHFSVRKDAVCFSSVYYIRRTSRDVNHFSVENPAIYRSSRDVNHFSVENPAMQFSVLENITLKGDFQSFDSRNNQHEPIYSSETI